MIPYKIEISDQELFIVYFGKLFENQYENIEMFYSFDETWEDTRIEKMIKTKYGFVARIGIKDATRVCFCFTCEDGTWDSDYGKNYVIDLVTNDNAPIEKQEVQPKAEEEKTVIQDRGTLLISEIKDKIFLPYKAEEIASYIQDPNNAYTTAQEVIDNVFVRSFKDYRFQYSARFRESIELITKRENMSYLDGINLAMELMGKKYLHPAIISACKNLDELNVYLDCLDKDELDDFKIFHIEYEIYPTIIKKQYTPYAKTSILQKMIHFLKRLFSKEKMLEN